MRDELGVRGCGARLHELDREHRATAADVADRGEALLQFAQCRHQQGLDLGCAREQPAGLDALEHSDGGRARDRVATERAAEPARVGGIHDLGSACDGGDRETGRDALGREHHIRHDVFVLAGVPGAGAGHARLNLVGDKDDALRSAPFHERGEVAGCRHDKTTLALHRLDHETREVLGANRLLEVRDSAGGGLSAGQPIPVGVRARRAVHVRGERAEAGGVGHRLEGHRHREVGAAVVGVVEHGDTRALRELAGDLHRVLHGLGSGRDDDRLLRVGSGGVLGEQLGDTHIRLVRRDREHGVGEALELRGRGGGDRGIRVADRGDTDARGEVDERIAVDIDDDAAVGAIDVDGHRARDARRNDREASLVQGSGVRTGDLGGQ